MERRAVVKALAIGVPISAVLAGGAALIGAGSPKPSASPEGTSPETFRRSLLEIGMRAVQAGGTDSYGLIGALTQFGTASFVQDAFGMAERRTTATTLNAEARIISTSQVTQRRHNPIIISKFALAPPITNIRMWIGLFSAPAQATPSNDPLSHLAGMRFSTSVPDTNFMFAVEDAATLNTFDTGIPGDSAVHYLIIKIDNSVPNITIELRNVNFTLQASNIFTSNLPASATNLYFHLTSIVNLLAGTAKAFQGYGAYVQRFINLDA